MMKSELFSWPVTMAILVLAFGTLVAAGLPLLLTILGLVASAGLLALLTHGFEISIWAMNFALMFALALGIDYALFVVHRFRGAFFGSKLDARDAVAVTMDTAGKAVLFSGATVLISLSAVMLVPSPAFRSMALGIMISVVFRPGSDTDAAARRAGEARSESEISLALPSVHSGERQSRSPQRAKRADRCSPMNPAEREGVHLRPKLREHRRQQRQRGREHEDDADHDPERHRAEGGAWNEHDRRERDQDGSAREQDGLAGGVHRHRDGVARLELRSRRRRRGSGGQ